MDSIKIKMEECYYIRINSCLPTYILINCVFSGIMLVGNNIADVFDDDGCSVFFSSYKALYKDHDNLIPFKINEKQFTEFYEPKELNVKDLTTLGIFR